jgi:hypothetical protein
MCNPTAPSRHCLAHSADAAFSLDTSSFENPFSHPAQRPVFTHFYATCHGFRPAPTAHLSFSTGKHACHHVLPWRPAGRKSRPLSFPRSPPSAPHLTGPTGTNAAWSRARQGAIRRTLKRLARKSFLTGPSAKRSLHQGKPSLLTIFPYKPRLAAAVDLLLLTPHTFQSELCTFLQLSARIQTGGAGIARLYAAIPPPNLYRWSQ